MSNYNCCVGVDQQVLNNLTANIYTALYPAVFKGQQDINNFGIKTIFWDITQTPVFNLNPSERAKALLKANVHNCVNDKELKKNLENYIDESVVAFELAVPVFRITIETTDGKTSPPIDGSIAVFLQAEINSANTLTGEITKSVIDIKGDPTLVWILNNIVLPQVEIQLNAYLLKGIQLPKLEFGGIGLSVPVPVLDNKSLPVFAALSTQGVTVPPAPGTNWPQNKYFVLGDPLLLDTVTAFFLKDLNASGSASTSFLNLKLNASYKVGVNNPKIGFAGGNSLLVGVDAYGSGSVFVQADFFGWKPKVTLGLGITASPTIKGQVQVSTNNTIIVQFLSVDNFKLKIELYGIPSWLNDFISEITSFLTKPIVQLIGSLLTGISFPVYTIPQFKISESGINLTISVSNIGINTLQDSGNKQLLAVTGNVQVTKST